jgi:HAD superfamily hydrolase (TIGR01549 family)
MKALIFDLDGTLVDSVYPHTIAWQQALQEIGLQVPACDIHRYIGISGKLLVKALSRRQGRTVDADTIKTLEARHDHFYRQMAALQIPLPGAKSLLQFLVSQRIAHGIATTGKRSEIEGALKALDMGDATIVVDGSATEHAKPEPDLFEVCQQRLGVASSDCLVVGDAVWDIHAARRIGLLAVGLLTGGTGSQELYNAGAMRVYRDPDELLQSIDELGLQLS